MELELESLTQEVREHNIAVRDQLAKLASRVAVLEESNRLALTSPKEDEPPPAKGALGDQLVDVGDKASQSSPDVRASEVYEFQQSVWDTQLFIGRTIGRADSILLVIYAVLNITVQASFAAVVYEISSESLTDDNLKEFAHWRMVEGHREQWYDPLTNTSLVRFACEDFGASLVAGPQQAKIANYKNYLDTEQVATLGFQQGPWICLLCVLLWVATILTDLWQVEHFAFALVSVWKYKAQTTVQLNVEGKYSLDKISTGRFTVAFLTIVLPRLAIDIGLLFAGFRFLVYENDPQGLILNAVALAFVLSLDELLFQLLPRNAQNVIQNLEPLRKTSRGVTKPGSMDLRSVLLFILCFSLVVYTWFEYLEPRINRMEEAYRLLCGGNKDFFFAQDKGTAFVYVADTEEAITGLPQVTYQSSAVLQYTNLSITGPVLTAFAAYVGPALYARESTEEVRQRAAKITDQALYELSCADQDTTIGLTRALNQQIFDLNNPEVGPGDFCSRVAAESYCAVPNSTKPFKALCPTTCGCNRISTYDREGCSSSCLDVVIAANEALSQTCTDVLYQSADAEVRAFFQNVQDSLVASGALVETADNLVEMSAASRAEFHARGGYQYLIPTSRLFMNALTWYSGGWGRRTLEDLGSPCKLLPFFYGLFNRDLCAYESNRGSARGFCPTTCEYLGCPAPQVRYTRNISDLDRQQISLNLWGSRRIFLPSLKCGQAPEVRLEDTYLIEQPEWGNGDFTMDLCVNNVSGIVPQVYVVDLETAMQEQFPTHSGECLYDFSIRISDRMRYIIQFAASQPIDKLQVQLTCHQDGVLSCGTPLQATTEGAVNLRGSPSPERIYGLAVPQGRELTFTACGTHFEPQLSLFWFSSDELQQGSLLRRQDNVSSAACAGGVSLTWEGDRVQSAGSAAIPPDATYAVVVEGAGNTTGAFTLEVECSYPPLECGAQVGGNTAALGHRYAQPAKEMIWRFSSGSTAINVTFDTCRSGSWDTDLYLYDSNMTLLASNDFHNTTTCGFNARIATTVPPNTDVNLLVEGSGALDVDYHLSVTCSTD